MSLFNAVFTRDNENYLESKIDRHPNLSKILRSLCERWSRSSGYVFANRKIREVSDRLVTKDHFSAAMCDEAVQDKAKGHAMSVARLIDSCDGDLDKIILVLRGSVESLGFEWPVDIKKKDSAEVVRQKNLGAVARVQEERWWRRKMRVTYSRQVEGVLRDVGQVRKVKAPYISNYSAQRWAESQIRNRETLANLEIEAKNSDGEIEVLPMLQAVDASVSNPENMQGELMVRMRGWEECAKALGLEGGFLTLTCPSRFHAYLSAGRMNPKYTGETPRECMAYLNSVWARIRAEWAREGIKTFGFRVAEPHHDGTPHWHLMLFFSPEEVEKAKAIFSRYAMAEDGDEEGASVHRWDWKVIDPGKGSAAGYIAKYVCKNITGKEISWDFEAGVRALEGAARVKAWASLWGIRQFQQIGCASVTVWREIRRRREPLEAMEPEEAEAIRLAADAQDWHKFVDLMGGAFSGRDDQTLRALHVVKPEPNSYGEEVNKIIGLVLRGASRAAKIVVTRSKVWKVQEAGTYERRLSFSLKGAEPPPLDLCQ